MSIYRALRPLLFTLPPEAAHKITLRGLRVLSKFGRPKPDSPRLSIWHGGGV